MGSGIPKMVTFSEVLRGKINKRLRTGYRVTSVRLTLNEYGLLRQEDDDYAPTEFPKEPVYFMGYPIRERK